MKKLLLSTLVLITTVLSAQKLDTLNLFYLSNSPFAYEENGQVTGIEVDIIKEYAAWLKTKKNTNVF